mmetsp:Transcript_73236/g.207505  ORF Transcript_73236/g.207505 Transcript_73236/m.207505 type:complete len:131 (+) Transcript_73236:2094-2486(+)
MGRAPSRASISCCSGRACSARQFLPGVLGPPPAGSAKGASDTHDVLDDWGLSSWRGPSNAVVVASLMGVCSVVPGAFLPDVFRLVGLAAFARAPAELLARAGIGALRAPLGGGGTCPDAQALAAGGGRLP